MLNCHVKYLHEDTTQSPGSFNFNAMFSSQFSGCFTCLQLLKGDTRAITHNRISHTQTGKRLRKIDFQALIYNGCCTQYFHGDLSKHGFSEVHQIMIIRVRLIELHHGEFRIVPRGESFVTKITVNFEYFFKSTHNQTLQIQLGCDAQVHSLIQRIVMRHKWLGTRTTRDHMHHGCFHFHKTLGLKVLTHTVDNF